VTSSPEGASALERTLGEMAAGVIRVVDGVIVYANPEAARIFGEPASALVGRRLEDFVDPSEREALASRRARRLRGERVPDAYVLTHLRPDGSRRHIEVEPRVAGENETVTVLRDVTDRVAPSALVVALTELAERLRQCRSAEEVLDRAGAALLELGLPCIWLRVEGDDVVFARPHLGAEIEAGLERALGRPVTGVRLPLALADSIGPVIHGRRSAFYEDAGPSVARFLDRLGGEPSVRFPGDTHRALVAPLLVRDQAWGALGVEIGRAHV
jgi:PAS domain S-box-containing protein